MPSSPQDPARLLAMAAELEQLGVPAREGAEEVLGHFPEIGDRETQVALDAALEQFADTLRAIDAAATEIAARLRISARQPGAGGPATSAGSPDATPHNDPDATPDRHRGAGCSGDRAAARRPGFLLPDGRGPAPPGLDPRGCQRPRGTGRFARRGVLDRPGARDIGKRNRLLVESAQATAAQLDRTGMALQAHATDLAEALHEARAVEERATVAGLRVVDGQVRLPWGVSGVADAASVSVLEDQRDLLQADLDRTAVLLARRRQRLVETLTAARVELAEQALALRS